MSLIYEMNMGDTRMDVKRDQPENHPAEKNTDVIIQVESPFKIKYESPEEFGDSFFCDVYKSAAGIVRSIVDKNKEFSQTVPKKGNAYRNNEQIYNAVSFVGDRGTGKTSCMLSFMEYMKDYYRLDKYKLGRDIQGKDLWSGDYRLDEEKKKLLFVGVECVDAGLLEEGEEIIEIILAKLLDKFSEYDTSAAVSRSRADYDYQKANFHLCLKKMYDSLQNLRNKQSNNKAYWEEEDASLERLSKLAVSIKLRENFKNLVTSFLEISRYNYGQDIELDNSYIVIAIDDIDMNLSKGYRMLEQIRRYLMVPKVVVLLSYNYSQLKSICDLYFSAEMKNLIDVYRLPQEAFQERVRELTKAYMEKVLPVGMQVVLPSISLSNSFERHRIKLQPFYGTTESGPYWNIKQIFQWKAAKCFGIYSLGMDEQDNQEFFWCPDSLRTLSNLYYHLHGMRECTYPLTEDAKDKLDVRRSLENNYRWLINYIYQRANLILDETRRKAFGRIFNAEVHEKISVLALETEEILDTYLYAGKDHYYDLNSYVTMLDALELWKDDSMAAALVTMYFSAVIGVSGLVEKDFRVLFEMIGNDGFGGRDYEISMKMSYCAEHSPEKEWVAPYRIGGIATGEGGMTFRIGVDPKSLHIMQFFLMLINIEKEQQILITQVNRRGEAYDIVAAIPEWHKLNLSISHLFWNCCDYAGLFKILWKAVEEGIEQSSLEEEEKRLLKIWYEANSLETSFRKWEEKYNSTQIIQLQNVEQVSYLLRELRIRRDPEAKEFNPENIRAGFTKYFDQIQQILYEEELYYQNCYRRQEEWEIYTPYKIYMNSPWNQFWEGEENKRKFSEYYFEYYLSLYPYSEEKRIAGEASRP